jgi:hypothetical protein
MIVHKTAHYADTVTALDKVAHLVAMMGIFRIMTRDTHYAGNVLRTVQNADRYTTVPNVNHTFT